MQPDSLGSSYDYTVAGFDAFLTRSIDGGQTALGTDNFGAMPSQQLAFDRSQISGVLGDTMRIGRIYLNGSQSNIVMNDGENDFFFMGDDDT